MSTTQTTLNGICPYFTIFPLDFPLNILKREARVGDIVLLNKTYKKVESIGPKELELGDSVTFVPYRKSHANEIITGTVIDINPPLIRMQTGDELSHGGGYISWDTSID